MPTYTPIAISYSQGGLVNDKAAFNLTDDSFQILENAFNFRGRIRRRQGYTSLGRLRRSLVAVGGGNHTTINGTNTYNIFTGLGVAATEPNASVEAGNLTNITITVGVQTLTNTTGTNVLTVGGGAGPITGATIDYATGNVAITANAAGGPFAVTLTLAYYPSLPVMGLKVREQTTINVEQLIAFDTKYAYLFSGSNFAELVAGTTWNGNNADFFWTWNILEALATTTNILFFATNFNTTTPDPIRYFTAGAWNNFSPNINSAGTRQLHQARILLQYRGRMVALNTFEGAAGAPPGNQFAQRARWSQEGVVGSPIAADSWLSDVAGKGSFIDAPTTEAIVSAEFVRDTLVVGFERSMWKLRYTGIKESPFVWDRINRELGCESTFSTVSFDKGVLSIGDKSINICDGNNVEPIDENIPDEVFQIHNGNSGPFRVYGVRDFFLRQVYWTFPNYTPDFTPTFPNRLLVYDYEKGSWARFTDSFTCMGSWQRSTGSLTWGEATFSWGSANIPWNSPKLQSDFPNIVGGNQEGYVVVMNQQVQNAPSLYISAIALGPPVRLTVVNHNMQSNEFITLSGIIGTASSLNNRTYKISRVDNNNFDLLERNPTTGVFEPVEFTGALTYFGLGEVTRIFNLRVRSKKFNLIGDGKRGYFGYIDFLAQTTSSSEIGCEIRVDYEDDTILNPETNPLGGGEFYNTFFTTTRNSNFYQTGFNNWQRFYCPTSAQFMDFTVTFNDRQMATPSIVNQEVLLEAFLVWVSKDGRLVK